MVDQFQNLKLFDNKQYHLYFFFNLIKINHFPFDYIKDESGLIAGIYSEYGWILLEIVYFSDYLNVLIRLIYI